MQKVGTESNEYSSVLPEYAASHLQVVVEKVRSLHNETTLNLLFVTDPHHVAGGNQLHTAKIITQLSEEIALDCIVCGGDMSENGVKSEVIFAQKEIMNELAKAKCPLLPVKGNHDDNSIHDFHHHPGSIEHVIFPEEMYDMFLKGLEGTVCFDADRAHGLYYYYDVPHMKTRVIILNCNDIPYQQHQDGSLRYNGQWKYAFSEKQLNWVAHTALNFSDKPQQQSWKVVFFSHVAIVQENIFGADHDITNGEAMWEIIKAYNGGTSYRATSEAEDFSFSISADFSGQEPGNVIACFFGHVHYDQVLRKDGIAMISTLNAVSYRDFEEAPARYKGTESETAFDVVSINYNDGKLYLTRFGAGKDRVVVL